MAPATTSPPSMSGNWLASREPLPTRPCPWRQPRGKRPFHSLEHVVYLVRSPSESERMQRVQDAEHLANIALVHEGTQAAQLNRAQQGEGT